MRPCTVQLTGSFFLQPLALINSFSPGLTSFITAIIGFQVMVLFTILALRFCQPVDSQEVVEHLKTNLRAYHARFDELSALDRFLVTSRKEKMGGKERRYLQWLGNNPMILEKGMIDFTTMQKKRTTNASNCGRQVGAPSRVELQSRLDVTV